MARFYPAKAVSKGTSGFIAIMLGLAGAFVSGNASADDWRFKGTVFADRNAENRDEDNRLDLRFRVGGELEASRNIDFQNGHKANVRFFVSSDVYPGYHGMTRFHFGAAGEYIIPWSYGIIRQLRFSGEFTHAHSAWGTVYDRPRLGMAVRLEPAKRHIIQLRARLGYRDQNDRLLAGYDQFEWLTDVTHLWTSEDRRYRTTTIFYVEGRKAKANRFDYIEVGARFIGRKTLSESRELVARVSGHLRNYTHSTRYDKRLRVTLGHVWKFQHALEVEAYAGWEGNFSTDADKHFGGGLIGLSISKEF